MSVRFPSCCYQFMCLCGCAPLVLTQDIPHIFAMTLFEEYIYWTDWETKSINRAHKTLGVNKTVLISTLHRPMDIHIYHPYRQPEGMTCSVSSSMSWFLSDLPLILLLHIVFALQWLAIHARPTMEDAVTCVSSHLEGATNVPALLTFILLLMANNVCPTALQVR